MQRMVAFLRQTQTTATRASTSLPSYRRAGATLEAPAGAPSAAATATA